MFNNEELSKGSLFESLEQISSRPEPFEYYSATDLWTDEHTSKKMLSYHLNGDIDVASRRAGFIDRSVEWIVSHFEVGSRSRIADFGCGPGLYTTRLARAQADVTGVDFSARSIQYAQDVAAREGLSIHYVKQNYLEFATDDRFDLVLIIMCDFCALSPEQRKELLARFLTILKPNGSVLFDVYSLRAFARREERTTYGVNLLDGFWAPHKYHGFLNTFKYEDSKVVLDKYTIVEPHRTRTIYNWLQYFSLDAVESELGEKGFRIQSVYSDVSGTPFDANNDEFAVVARKAENY